MPSFNPSVLSWLQMKTRVATVSGSEAFADMLIRAGYALEEALRYWENYRDWKYLMTQTTNTFSGTVTGGTTFNLDTNENYRYIAVGMKVTGSAILTTPTTVVTAPDTGDITLSAAATNGATSLTFSIATVAGTSEYLLPTQFKKPYTARLTENNPRTLVYLDQRYHDLIDVSQTSSGVPVLYKLYNTHETGKVVLYPGNEVADTLLVKYYRRHFIPSHIQTGATTSDAVLIDFPAQYQTALLAQARAIFLADKGGAPPERLQYWVEMAERWRRQAVADDEFLPDADHGFVPASSVYNPAYAGPNDVQTFLDY